MRTDEERMRLIFNRTEEIKRQRKLRKRQYIGAGCMIACVLMILSLGISMPGFMEQAVSGKVIHNSGVASLIAGQTALGYIVVGIFCFVLGAAVAILLYKIKEHDQEKQGDKDEL